MRVRVTARVVLFDGQGRVLLMKGRFPWDKDGPGAWFTVGGGAEPGETLEACAAREVVEETGYAGVVLGPVVHTREVVHGAEIGDPVLFRESYFVGWCLGGDPARDGWRPEEREYIDDVQWWDLDALAGTDDPVFPEGLARLAAGWREAHPRPGRPTCG